jgi:hypothetical protein
MVIVVERIHIKVKKVLMAQVCRPVGAFHLKKLLKLLLIDFIVLI